MAIVGIYVRFLGCSLQVCICLPFPQRNPGGSFTGGRTGRQETQRCDGEGRRSRDGQELLIGEIRPTTLNVLNSVNIVG